MKSLLGPLVDAENSGVNIPCADGLVHRIFPILAAYVADHPEQCLIMCCQENCYPCCVYRGEETQVPGFLHMKQP